MGILAALSGSLGGGSGAVEHYCVEDFFSCGEVKGDRDALRVEGADGRSARTRARLAGRRRGRPVFFGERIDQLSGVGVEAAKHFHDDRVNAMAGAQRGVVDADLRGSALGARRRAEDEVELVHLSAVLPNAALPPSRPVPDSVTESGDFTFCS